MLFTAFQGGRWFLVRMGVDGAMEYAGDILPGAPGDPLEPPLVLETR